ncbi:hypothetical protein STRATTON_41 [Erwinia phage vB_EamM_Stratton]|uniref:Uncharacterized protein n=2 Tax=Erskinevirus EaH2 TaxID=2169883 RepID=A0A1B2IGR9_9CAUD|nr:hypothetical protein G173_gp208 [Erwinia phage phiEaH2]AFQ96753.1 hypothetical protein [Erwinia phage phiEaH2]ANZ50466.1 hypothetical protein STRATTON_41 [Erwinia phage vB_EamM_Stratton]
MSQQIFNGVPVDELHGKMKFEFDKLCDFEKELLGGQYVCSTFTEAMFRRQGLPLLSGMLDNTFNEVAWENYVGNAFVPLQIVSDLDHSQLLFTIPPLMNTGRSLQHIEGQVSLTEETENIRLQADIISEVGEQQMHQMIDSTLSGIEQLSYLENAVAAKYKIDLLNWIFRRYQLNGQLEYPDGLLDVVAFAEGKGVAAPSTKAAVAAQPTAQPEVKQVKSGGIGDGDDDY